jgi:hypothetical protein
MLPHLASHESGAAIRSSSPAMPSRTLSLLLLIPCSMADVAGGAFVGARHAWIGGLIRCGAGFLALAAVSPAHSKPI